MSSAASGLSARITLYVVHLVHAPRALPQDQLVEWIRDCHALCCGAETRGDEKLYIEALEELRVLFDVYLRRFPGQPPIGEHVLN